MRDKGFLWFRLVNAPGFGAKSVHYLFKNMQAQGMPLEALFESEEPELQRLFPAIGQGRFAKAQFARLLDTSLEAELWATYEQMKEQGVYVLGMDDYPTLVHARLGEEAPPLLYAKGALSLLYQRSVAIAGARNVSESEVSLSGKVGRAVALSGFNVVSGYAKGVDTAAHLGALEADGTTTCVLSLGLQHLSLKDALEADGTTTCVLSLGLQHLSLKDAFEEQRWEKNTLFLSQFAPWENFSGRNAMTRNRLICALSEALIVIKAGPEKDEKGQMSGTFHAGKNALEMGLPLWVLNPERLSSPAPGNEALIEKGGLPFGSDEELQEMLRRLNERPPTEAPSAPGQQGLLF